MSTLNLKNIYKSFDKTEVLKDINLEVASGEFVVFVGPSGCGKSTLLRVIAGLETPTAGEVRIADTVVNDISAAHRGCAMVFQSYALYPHMTVYANMAFGLENAGIDKATIKKKVSEAAAMLKLDTLLQRKPTQLSGGQRQRVAIGRAIVREPKLFLFDEPLSNLDAELRVSTRAELRELHARLGTTMIYVTHDQVEAMTLADKIVVLRAGKIEQIGTPKDLYENPCNEFVAGFIGSPRMNFVTVSALAQSMSLPSSVNKIGIRPEHLLLSNDNASTSNAKLTMRLISREYMGASSLLRGVLPDNTTIEVMHAGNFEAAVGDTLRLDWDTAQQHGFDVQGLRV